MHPHQIHYTIEFINFVQPVKVVNDGVSRFLSCSVIRAQLAGEDLERVLPQVRAAFGLPSQRRCAYWLQALAGPVGGFYGEQDLRGLAAAVQQQAEAGSKTLYVYVYAHSHRASIEF